MIDTILAVLTTATFLLLFNRPPALSHSRQVVGEAAGVCRPARTRHGRGAVHSRGSASAAGPDDQLPIHRRGRPRDLLGTGEAA
jgi:hypothetical protein